jgi:uncharacterized phage protein gp47/JayE
MEAEARTRFGEAVNLTERSPLGLFIGTVATSIDDAWKLAESVYYSAYVDTATGESLDRVGAYIGIVRRPAVRATGEVTVSGDDDTIVPIGFRVETESGIEFYVSEYGTIAAGSVTVPVAAVVAGRAGNVAIGTITEIPTPMIGISSVTNAAATTGGLRIETDAEFRARYKKRVAIAGAGTIDSIRATLRDIEGVRGAIVVENNTDTVDGDGRPAHSFESYVLGPSVTDEEIGLALLGVKSGGIQAFGVSSVVVQDDAGSDHTIGFTRATAVDIEVGATITTNALYPSDGDTRVVTEIVKYIGGDDADGSVYPGLTMGDDVIVSRIARAIYNVPGVTDVVVEICVSGGVLGSANIEIEINEIAEVDHADITVISS